MHKSFGALPVLCYIKLVIYLNFCHLRDHLPSASIVLDGCTFYLFIRSSLLLQQVCPCFDCVLTSAGNVLECAVESDDNVVPPLIASRPVLLIIFNFICLSLSPLSFLKHLAICLCVCILEVLSI